MASNSTSGAMAPQDPFSQSFTLLQADGTAFSVNLGDLHAFELYNIRICINYGCQIGASLLLLLVLILVTSPDKRRAPIFIINVLSLAFNFIRSLLLALYFTGGFTEPYAFFAGDWSRVTSSDYANSVAAVIFTLLVLLCVEASLMMQVAVVCATMKSLHRRALLAACAMVASVAIGFRAALVVQNIKSIVRTEASETWKGLVLATNVTTTISICIFCALFAVKLGIAMRERRKLHLRQYGPMRILFIMGCQTMLIPAVFAVLQHFTPAPELGTNVLTVVAIFLPLSSTWAAASVNNQSRKLGDLESQHRFYARTPAASKGRSSKDEELTGPFSPIGTTSSRAEDDCTLTTASAVKHNQDQGFELKG